MNKLIMLGSALLASLVLVSSAGCIVSSCKNSGGSCGSSVDCCGLLTCNAGVCGSASACQATGQSCNYSSDCCGSNTCNGGICGSLSACQPSGGSCAHSVDCCGTNTCNGGYCGAAICGGVGETCVSSYDCCGSLLCTSSGYCASTATCGGQGASCYNSNDCCGSLYCDGTGTCTSGSTSTMTFKFNDSCNNGEDIRYKFWDVTYHEVWPSSSTSYIASYGSTYSSALSCTTGNNICVGATQTSHGGYWGVNVDNSASCSDCCFTCANTTVTYTASCP